MQPSSFLVDTTVPAQTPIPPFGPMYWTANRTYCFSIQTSGLITNRLGFYLSLDGGATWSRPDSANAAACDGAAVFFWDGLTPTCNILFRATAAGNVPIALQNFDLDTETYGPVYGTVGAPLASFVGSVVRMANGDLLCFYERVVSGIRQRLFCSIFSGGVWGVEFAVADNLPPTAFSRWETTVFDPVNNLVHIFFSQMVFTQAYYYRQMAQDGTMGAVTSFAAGDAIHSAILNLGHAFDAGYVRNGTLFVTVFRSSGGRLYLSALTGTPLPNPVFTLSPPIDPDFLGDPAGCVVPGAASAFTDGTVDYIAYFTGDSSCNQFNQIRLATNSGAGWTRAIIYDAMADPNGQVNPHTNQWLNTISAASDPNGDAQYQFSMWHAYAGEADLSQFSTQFIQNPLSLACGSPPAGQIGVPYSSALVPSGGSLPYTFAIIAGALPTGLSLDASTGIISGTPSAPGTFNFSPQVTDGAAATASVACSISITSGIANQVGPVIGGAKIPVPRAFNEWDSCLQGMRRCYVQICRRICPQPRPAISWPWDLDEGVPPDAEPFRKTGGIVTPLTAAGDVAVFSFRVPVGYDGVIMQGYNLYQGTGFVQGSGDILWRLQVNNRYYLKDWGNVAFQFGSVNDPFPFTDAVWITSNQTVTMLVNVPNLSGAIQVGASRILGALMGYFLPR